MNCRYLIFLLMIATALLVGCNGPQEEPEEKENNTEVVIEMRDEPSPLSNWDERGKRVGPDYWRGEYLVSLAEQTLGELREVLPKTSQLGATPSALTPAFQLSGWSKGQLEPVFSDTEIIVNGSARDRNETAVWLQAGGSQPMPAVQALKTLMAPWEKCHSIKLETEINDIVVHDNYFLTNVSVSILGVIQNAGSRQATMNWLVQWTLPATDQLPKINAIQITSYDETSYLNPAGRMFSDCTGSVMKDVASLKEQMAYGSVQWTKKLGSRRIRNWYGISVCDINNDYLDDFYVCQGRGIPNRLYVQNPDGTVKDISAESGTAFSEPTNCALFADLDNDGDQDLLLAVQAGITILINDGENRFHFKTVLFGAKNAVCLAVSDFDNDNDLDILAGGYLAEMRPDIDYPAVNYPADATNGGGVTLYQNEGDLNFKNRTDRSELDTTKFVTGLFLHDQDGDGDDDLFVTNDFGSVDYFENKGDWFSKNKGPNTLEQPGMYRSLNWLDTDGDGNRELAVLMGATASQRRIAAEFTPNAEKPFKKQEFEQLVRQSYLIQQDGTTVDLPTIPNGNFLLNSFNVDLNGDGFDDLMLTHGGTTREDKTNWSDYYWREMIPKFEKGRGADLTKQLAKIFFIYSNHIHAGGSHDPSRRNGMILNTGRNRLVDISAVSGLDQPLDSRASAYLDWDHDGDWDIVQVNALAPQVVLSRNESKPHSFVKFHLKGIRCNAEAIGALIELHVAGAERPLRKKLACQSGMLSQSSRVIRFSLPANAKLEKAVVTWPDRSQQEFAGLSANQMYLLVQDRTAAELIQRAQPASAFVPSPAPVNTDPVLTSRVWPKLKHPSIEYQPAGQDQWMDLQNSKKMTLIHLCKKSDSSFSGNLEQMRSLDSSYRKVILSLDSIDFASQTDDAIYGRISPSGFDRLRVFGLEVFGDSEHFATPCWILVDEDARITTTYSKQLDPQMLKKDRDELATVVADTYQPFPRFEHRQISNLLVPDYLRLAETYGRAGYLEESRLTVRHTKSQMALGYCQRAQGLVEQGRVAEAMKVIEAAIELDSTCREAFLLLGKLELGLIQSADTPDQEFIAKATEYFERALLLDPNNVDARLGLADLAEQNGKYDEAVEIIDAAIGHLDKQRLIVDQKYRLYWIKGRLYYRQKDYVNASKALATAFDLRPIEVALVTDLAMVYAASNDFESALRFFVLARNLSPKVAVYTKTVGVCQFILGDYESAIKTLENATEMASRDRTSRLMLAWILATNPKDSLRDGERALKLAQPIANVFRDSSPQALEVYAAALAENGQFKKAVEVQTQAMNLAKTVSLPPEELRPLSEMKLRLEVYQRNEPLRMNDKGNHPFPRIISDKGMYVRRFR